MRYVLTNNITNFQVSAEKVASLDQHVLGLLHDKLARLNGAQHIRTMRDKVTPIDWYS